MKLYLAGPMRGRLHYNFPEFDKVAYLLRDAGHHVISPAELDRDIGFDETSPDPLPFGFVEEALRRDVAALLEVDAIALMDGWQDSSGACFEFEVARRLGLECYEVHVVERVGSPAWCYLAPVDVVVVDLEAKGRQVTAAFDAMPIGDPHTDEVGNICSGEVRVTSDTGGSKGSKAQQVHHIPPRFLLALGAVYTVGNDKYPDADRGRPNWSRGYDWSLSYSAMHRHLAAFWGGEYLDPEDGQPHIVKVAWHAATLYTFAEEELGTDDRPAYYREVS